MATSRRGINLLGLVRWLFLAFLLAFTALPMIWMVSTSLKTEFAAIQQPTVWIPAEPTFEQYTTLLSPVNRTGQQFLGYLRNSVWVSFATTVLGVLIAVPAAYAFSRFSFPGREPLFFSVLVRNMFPVVVFLIPLFILMKFFRLIDTHFSLILTYLTFGLPLSIWLLKGFYDNIPPELERAARIDGATRFQAFWKIILPLSTPGIAVTALFSFMTAWNEFIMASTFMTDESRYTLPVLIQSSVGQHSADYGLFAAGAVVTSIPVMIAFYVLQKYLVGGLTAGAVKG
jgi:multiple sugar transport system permease protein